VQKIIVHSSGCSAVESTSTLNVFVKDIEELVEEVYGLMKQYSIPFYRVEPHNASCPGPGYPWEDLEYQLFVLTH